MAKSSGHRAPEVSSAQAAKEAGKRLLSVEKLEEGETHGSRADTAGLNRNPSMYPGTGQAARGAGVRTFVIAGAVLALLLVALGFFFL